MAPSATKSQPGNTGSTVNVSIDRLRMGVELRRPVLEARTDDREVLLLSAGQTITDAVIAGFRQRGITHLQVRRSELDRLVRPRRIENAAKAKPVAERIGDTAYAVCADSFVHHLQQPEDTQYSSKSVQQCVSQFKTAVGRTQQLFADLAHSPLHTAAPLEEISHGSLDTMTTDMDIFVAIGISPAKRANLQRHGMQSAMLAQSMGTLLGLSKTQLIELGIGCLVHDVGMTRLRPELVTAPRRLTDIEMIEIKKHPGITVDLVQAARDVPHGAIAVAQQIHERCDGSGYPRGRTKPQINPLARIAAAADAYTAMISPRPWREAIAPHLAVRELLQRVGENKFDATVIRALLQAVSLVPLGSRVELSDGRSGRVVRANRDDYTRPMIECSADADQRPEIVDLAEEQHLAIRKVG